MTIISDREFDVPESDDEGETDQLTAEDSAAEGGDPADHDHDHDDDDHDGRESAAEFVDRELQRQDDEDDNAANELDRSDEEPASNQEAAADQPPQTEALPMADQEREPEPPMAAPSAGTWTGRQAASVLRRVLAVAVLFGLVGYGLGFSGGPSSTARAEFVYTLDESVPDSFLREDRRLLTQVVTFESDAVLTPVGREFGLTADQLRSKIDVGTLNLSEVLHLDVTDADPDRAVAINRAVLDRYLQVIADASPAGGGGELEARRAEISARLTEADGERLALTKAKEQDVVLELRQESLQRSINIGNERINVLQQTLDTAAVQRISAAQVTTLTDTLATTKAEQAELETQLLAVGAERAELVTATTAEPALLREIARLEAKLATVDDELAERELAPLVASPIRELSEPIVEDKSSHLSGLQGMALGLLIAVPVAGLAGYHARRRQLWFD